MEVEHTSVRVKKSNVNETINEYESDGWRYEHSYLDPLFDDESYVYLEFYRTIQDPMICATRHSGTNSDLLLETMTQKGLFGVYNLGLKDMYNYLNQK